MRLGKRERANLADGGEVPLPLGDQHALARSVADDLAVAHPDDSLRVFGDIIFMGHHNDSLASVIKPTEHHHDFMTGGGVEVARGLVGEDDVGIVDQ